MIVFLEPWCSFVPGQGEAFLKELRHEVAVGHQLYGFKLVPLGHSGASDDVLFEADDGRVFQVHLTWSERPEDLPLPCHQIYSDAEDWVRQVMLPTHEEWRT
jgi:hypothetical protein